MISTALGIVLVGLGAGPEAVGAKEALASREFPWYDAAADDYRWVPLARPSRDKDDDAKPEQLDESDQKGSHSGSPDGRGKERSGTPDRPRSEPPRDEFQWEFSFADPAGIFTAILWVLFGVLVAFLLYLLLLYLRNKAAEEPVPGKNLPATPAERVEALPEAVGRVGDFLAAAERCVANNDLEQAAIYYFAYQLLALDRRGRIELAKGKTNRRYLRELARSDAPLVDTVGRSSWLFERALFGKLDVPRDAFLEVWQQRNLFRAMMEGRSSHR